MNRTTGKYNLMKDVLVTGPYKGTRISKIIEDDIDYIVALVDTGEYEASHAAKSFIKSALATRDDRLHDLCTLDEPEYYE